MEIVLKELQDKVANLEARMVKQEKLIRKLKKEMIPESERKVRTPSGFAKPTYLSPGLCEFLGIPENEELPRTEVTKRVLQYVKDQNLQNAVERRVINMDDKLQKLLNPPENEQVTYFTIQKLLKVHYVKPNSVVEVTTEVVAKPPAAEKSTKAVTKPKTPRGKVTKA